MTIVISKLRAKLRNFEIFLLHEKSSKYSIFNRIIYNVAIRVVFIPMNKSNSGIIFLASTVKLPPYLLPIRTCFPSDCLKSHLVPFIRYTRCTKKNLYRMAKYFSQNHFAVLNLSEVTLLSHLRKLFSISTKHFISLIKAAINFRDKIHFELIIASLIKISISLFGIKNRISVCENMKIINLFICQTPRSEK